MANEVRLLGFTPREMADDPALGASVRRAMAARQDSRLRFASASFSRLACKAMGRTFNPIVESDQDVFLAFFERMDPRGRIKGLADPAAGREAVVLWRELDAAGYFPARGTAGGPTAA